MSQFEELAADECLRLLKTRKVGRIAWSASPAPPVLPVNYTVVDGAIWFRTAPYSSIVKALEEDKVSFQVDEIDEFLACGWSVLVIGSAECPEEPRDIPHDMSDRPDPWAAGDRRMYVRVTPDRITGRRVHPIVASTPLRPVWQDME